MMIVDSMTAVFKELYSTQDASVDFGKFEHWNAASPTDRHDALLESKGKRFAICQTVTWT